MNLTFEQIKELHSMGFTPEQITSFTTSPATIPGDQAGEASGEEDSTASTPSPAPAISEPVDNPVETVENSEPDTLKELRDEIRGLKASIQAQNIRTQSIEVVNDEDKLEKAMAEFIRPTYKEKEE